MEHSLKDAEGICVIAQPTFLPWIGWFDLMDQADVFVLFDDAQFSKQSWQQRNRVRTARGLEFVSIPVKTSGRLGQRIMDCELADEFAGAGRKILRTIQDAYGTTPFFSAYYDGLSAIITSSAAGGRLLALNEALIRWCAAALGIDTPIVYASDSPTGGARGERVARLCEAVRAKRYLSTPGAEDYLRDDRAAFEARNIDIEIHVYEHPIYQQRYSPFIPFACAIDALFNIGPSAAETMRAGRRPGRPISDSPVSVVGETHPDAGA